MAWVILAAAGVFEVLWAVCLKESRGFTRVGPTVGFGAFSLASVGLLGIALKSLPLGTAYSVWTGIGAIGTVVVGILWLGENADPRRLACVGLILAGILGLKLLTPG